MTMALIGVDEAAAALGLTRQGVARRVTMGELTPLARVGKRGTLIFSRDIIQQLAENERKNKGARAHAVR